MGCSLYIDRVPECDCGRDEGEPTCSVALLLEATFPDLAEAAEEDGPSEGVASFTFVEASVNAAAEVDALKPRQDEQGAFYPAQLAESDSEAVLARIAAQLAKHEARRHSALPDGGSKAKDVIPVRADRSEVDGASDHGRKCPILDLAVGQIQLGVAEVPDAWSEVEAGQMHESEDMVREAGGVGVMLLDPQVGFMMQQPIENVGGVSHADVHDLGTEGRVLVRDMGVEELPRFGAYLGLMWPVLSALPPARKRCPSEDDVVPSPQCSAKGCRDWALTSSARAAE